MSKSKAKKQQGPAFDLDYARQVILGEAEAVGSVVSAVDESFELAARMIHDCAGSVIVTGIGKAGIIGHKISATLASTGTPSHFLHPAEAVHGDLGRLRAGDVVLVLSYGGETDEIIRVINLVKMQKISMIAITGSDESTLARYSDVVIRMGGLTETCPLGVAPSASTTCMLAIGDALAFVVMKARNFSVEDYARYHPGGSLGRKLMTVRQSMMFQPGEKLPLARVDETFRQMLAGTRDVKRHGATMIVDAKGRLAGIITDGDMRRLLAEHGEKAFDMKTGKIMKAQCKSISQDALAAEAMAIFNKYRIDDLPVVDAEGRPVGLIDVQDVVAIKVVG
jgi:arabinose-5-phosphate isomerase